LLHKKDKIDTEIAKAMEEKKRSKTYVRLSGVVVRV
jgi:hypothetical protein